MAGAALDSSCSNGFEGTELLEPASCASELSCVLSNWDGTRSAPLILNIDSGFISALSTKTRINAEALKLRHETNL